MTRPRLRAALVLAAVFAAGAASGSAVTVGLVARRMTALFEGDPKQTLAHLYGNELDRRLHLTAAQRADVERIVNDDHAELARIGQSVYPQLSAMRARRHARIRALLTGEQQRVFDGLASDYERRRRAEIDLP